MTTTPAKPVPAAIYRSCDLCGHRGTSKSVIACKCCNKLVCYTCSDPSDRALCSYCGHGARGLAKAQDGTETH